ncbi:MAG: alpha-galactosidase [Paracoccus sp. (in: a-proteobacteria)]|uniref:alpha-galactosidase n=1 Tax=Paracoccus sp. TaxID=267 RepID=UPI0026DF18DD|nr:alpha-galactosidase [Paracoccus sp. (in: a-proteobacteria)]MDO5630893.1 alpha-galactosidase [Paracoccus sp. (in: a-proteobacteria)]
MRCWRVDSGAQTLVLVSGGGMARCAYWGPRLPEDEDLAALTTAAEGGVSGGMLDALPPLTLCPEARHSFPGPPGLVAYDASGPVEPDWRLTEARHQGDTLHLTHQADGLALEFRLAPRPHGMIVVTAHLRSEHPVSLHYLSLTLPVPAPLDQITTFSGRWLREFQPVTMPLRGTQMTDARTGRSGHEHVPHVILSAPGTTHTDGTAHAIHYAWSGGHRMIAAELPDGRRMIQIGDTAGSERLPATDFATAEIWLMRGDEGLNSINIAMQRTIRDRLPPARQPRPVHYNSWEAVYFRHDPFELTDIARRAAALGAERFVLDDGWFGRRDDDTTSLGDWQINPSKYPQGFGPLIEQIHALGMSFGLWIEPEMISEDSDLFRAHPDWVLGPKDQIRGRNQFHLDMARQDVRAHIFARLDALLTDWPIDYLKWDHNRLPPFPDTAQTRGAYALLDRLRAAHPGVEIESCASGGGRIDGGILTRCARVWLSDSNDAVERLRIQHDAAFLPACATGSHVGPRICHSSGRILPMTLRAWVAAQRHMGFEMDPRELTEDEAATLHRITAWWKANRGWMMAGDIWRLDTAPETVAEMQIAADGARFIVFAASLATAAPILPTPLRLTGLNPAARYRLTLIERPSGHPRARTAICDAPVTLSGAALMAQGVALPPAFPQTIAVIEGQRL